MQQLHLLDFYSHWRHFHLMWLTNSPLCRRCGAQDVTSTHILCGCEALPSLRHAYLGSFCLDPEAMKSMGAIWNCSKGTELPWTSIRLWGTEGPVFKACPNTNQPIKLSNTHQPSRTVAKEHSSPELVSDYGAQRGPFLRPGCIGTVTAQIQTLINQSNCQTHINYLEL